MDLPKEFDVIVLGTGMPESIVAAAFARIGQTVLHLDKRENYSGDWASFNLQGIEKWAEQHQGDGTKLDCLSKPSIDEVSVLEEGKRLVEMPLDSTSFSNVHYTYHVCDEVEEEKEGREDKTDSNKLNDASKVVTNVDLNIDQVTADGSIPKSATNDTNIQDLSDTVVKATLSDSEKKSTNEGIKIETQEQNDQSSQNESNAQSRIESTDGVELQTQSDEQNENTAKSRTGNSDGAEYNENSKPESTTSATAVAVGIEEKPVPKMKVWSQKSIKAEWRRFNIDVSPKVLYSVGDMVSLLIESDIAKYCEFKTVTQILTLLEDKVEKVPCSRADVFSSKRVSMLEKRMLMKFIQYCLDYENKQDEIADQLDKPFRDFLKSKKLTPTIQHYVQHSIAMATDSMTARQGLERMKKFLSSLGRYGNTAFLWSLYGSGELPQAFCRMCAVFGGVYCLRTTAAFVTLDKDKKCTSIITTEGQKIKCKWLIMESSYAPDMFVSTKSCQSISRAIIMTDKPLLTENEQEQLSMMNIPCPDDGDRPVLVLQLPPSCMSAPRGIYITHLTRKAAEGMSPEQDLSYAVTRLFPSPDPAEATPINQVLWSLYFTQQDRSQVQASGQLPGNVVLVSGSGPEMDIDRPVTEAREIFKRILPDEEFLPKAPNPEDIIYIDDAEAKVANSNDQSEFAEQNSGNQSESVEQKSADKSSPDQSELVEKKSGDLSESVEGKSDNQSDSVEQNLSDQSKSTEQKSYDQSEPGEPTTSNQSEES